MHQIHDEFEGRGIGVIAIAQEDKTLDQHARLPDRLPDGYAFEVVADLNREKTPRYDRVTTYYITSDGIVRQVFPQLIHHRAAWRAILNEIDRLREARGASNEDVGGDQDGAAVGV